MGPAVSAAALMGRWMRGAWLPACLLCSMAAFAAQSQGALDARGSDAGVGPDIVDDTGQRVRLEHRATRIVALSPHLTELLFAAGAGERLVGAVEFSNHPEAAKALPRLGSYEGPDLERILALKPDLVVAWESGNGSRRIAQLRRLGLTVFTSEPRHLEDIPRTLEALGRLAGTSPVAREVAMDFRARLDALRARYARSSAVDVFYQVWDKPVTTLNGDHLVSRVMELCGGRNVFADLEGLAPVVSVEAVLDRDPRVIVAGGMADGARTWLQGWRRWPSLRAVREGHLVYIHPDHLQRHTPRILDGAEELCRVLDGVRGS
ncbi:MAG: cobalamin-binding protein [Gammaproteobacteria bacterium]